MSRSTTLAALSLALPAVLAAQQRTTPGPAPAPAPARVVVIPPPAEQIAAAVLPAPAETRDGATVLGYTSAGDLVLLRVGTGDLVCLADDPADERFHVACYHESLEPFMARGRALRASGVKGDQVDSVRFAEAKAGTLALPSKPAALYSLTGPAGTWDPKTGTATGARALYVIYVPYATAESTGLSLKSTRGAPWLMNPGTPKAHIMLVPSM